MDMEGGLTELVDDGWMQFGRVLDALPYFYITLGTATFFFFLELLLDLRQLVHLGALSTEKWPAELTRWVRPDIERVRKFNNWSMNRVVFNRLEAMFEFLGECLVLSGNFLVWIWLAVLHFLPPRADADPRLGLAAWVDADIVRGMAFILIVSLLCSMVRLPFALYRMIFIDNNFQPSSLAGMILMFKAVYHWLAVQFKVFVMSMLFGVPAISAILLLLQSHHEHTLSWLYVALLLSGLSILVTDIYQIFVPFFESFEELEQLQLKEEIRALAARLRFPLHKIKTVRHSGIRSVHSNAYLIGWRWRKTVILYDSVVENLETAEILAIVAHEIGHHKCGHTYKTLLLQILALGYFVFSLACVIDRDAFYVNFGFERERSAAVGLVLFAYMHASASCLVHWLTNLFSRHFEFVADEYAVRVAGLTALDDALIKIHSSSFTNVLPDPWYARYHYSHPSLIERLERIEAIKNKIK